MNWGSRGVATALMLVAGLTYAATAGSPPRVDVVTPQGEAKSVRQIAVRFSEPMVAFGDPRVADPFDLKCQGDAERLKGRGRWADPRNWIYDFESDLPAGQRCTLTLKPDAKTLAGQTLDGKKEFAFNTGGPAVINSFPREGEEDIDEEQVFILALDAKPDSGSLSDAWCEAAGINERIPLKVLSEKETNEILEANRGRVYNLFHVYMKGDRRIVPFAQFKVEDKRWRELPVLAVRCAQRLPAGAKVQLVLGPNVKTTTGISRGQPQKLAFEVRKAFNVKLVCERANKDGACLPVTPIRIVFNAQVPREMAEGIRLKSDKTSDRKPVIEPNVKSVESIEFAPPFAEKARMTVELPRNFKDDAGREPENKAQFPLATGTDEAPPLAKFPGRFGILELNADPVLPVTVRNVEPTIAGKSVDVAASGSKSIGGRSVRVTDEVQIMRRYQDFWTRGYIKRARVKGADEPRPGEVSAIERGDRVQGFDLPRGSSDRAMEVIGIPLKKPGFYVVELVSPRLGRALHGEEKPYYVSTSVLVTNLSVHLKHGREGSLVWVTSLDRAKPVANARVTVMDCTGHIWFEGTTDTNGIADVLDKLPVEDAVKHCGDYRRALVAFAKLGEDVSFTYSDWRDGISPMDFNLPTAGRSATPLTIHTVFDRTLFRAGDTVSMKHIARSPTGSGFSMPAADTLPQTAEIEHLGSGQKATIKLRFDEQGIAESTWTIPKEAKLGHYRVSWKSHYWLSGGAQFRVEAFRVPLMRAVLAAPKEPMIKPADVKLDAAVNYLAGGGAAHLPVKVRSRVEERGVSFRDLDGFQFGGRPIKEGISTLPAENQWSTVDPDEDAPPEASPQSGSTSVRTLTLDASGTAKVTIDKLPAIDRPSSLLVEMEYSDPNGEILAVATRVPLHTAGVYVGVKPEGWAASKSAVRAQVIAVDAAGKPLPNRSVTVDVYERKSYSNRRRLVGGFYAYDSITETKKVGSGCSGTTDARGLVFCTVKPRTIGEVILVARAKDDAGRESQADASVWVRGADDWWFEPVNNDRIDLIPEKKSYEPGETAKFQVRMPFREATVLVTVEREGVLSKQVVQLDGKSPVIEVPIAGTYGPNVFVSALALRGRVDPEVPGPYAWLKNIFYRVVHWLGFIDDMPMERDTRPTALVDLTKPSYKLGLTEIKVGRRDYALNVKVTPDRDVFKVRQSARIGVEVTDMNGKPAANAEIALAAVDEGLLELMDNSSWNILEGMLGARPAEVSTSTAQGQVIGKRHFGKKAVTHGGGGGGDGARELFDTLLLWKGRVPLDAQGRASLTIPLNDSLTSFRVVAVATAGIAKFGHGASTIRTTQDLMLFSGLSPIVREQDHYSAMFTLRNTTAQPVTARLDWAMRDNKDDAQAKTLAKGDQSVQLAPSEAKVISLPVKAPIGVEKLYWDIVASGAGDARDRLRVTQTVKEVHPVRVYQATLAQLDKPLELPVERPADAVPGRGSVRVDVMGTIGGDLTAVREYFLRYPYTCLEQRASKAIGLSDNALWSGVGASLPNYLDRDGLAKYFPIPILEGSDVLTAYLVQIADESGRELPEEALGKMLRGLEGFATGRVIRGSALPTADLTIRKIAAIEALSRHKRAKKAMLDPLTIDPALWPTSALIDWIGILKRVEDIPKRNERLQEALGLLRGRMNFQGTVMTFSTERNDALWWLMISGDVNANRGLLAVLDQPEWREDVGRLVRGTLSRQKRGTWNTTTANAWGTVALTQFAKAFEKDTASGTTSVSLGGESLPVNVTRAPQTRDLAWPQGRETLSIAHKGTGAPWAIVQSRAAIPLKAPLFTGYSVKRSIAAVEQKDRSGWSRGDVYRVTLEIDAQSDMTWVVVDDPIPSGAQILGSGLGRDAASLTQGEKQAGWTSATFIERTQEAYRAYYQFVPKGKFKLEYTVRLNNPGRFDLPATRVEALYAPEMFGELPNDSVAVK